MRYDYIINEKYRPCCPILSRYVEKLARSNKQSIVTAIGYEKGGMQIISLTTLSDIMMSKSFRMSINTEEPVHILLIGPPASAKTMFIKSMMM